MPLISKVITITGDAVNNTSNIDVSFGMNYQELIDDIGGFKSNPEKIINGGPMMGTAIYDLNIPIAKNSSSILAFKKDELNSYKEKNCINCGRWTFTCPINLTRVILYKKVRLMILSILSKLYGQECIECGACSYCVHQNYHLLSILKIIKFFLKITTYKRWKYN